MNVNYLDLNIDKTEQTCFINVGLFYAYEKGVEKLLPYISLFNSLKPAAGKGFWKLWLHGYHFCSSAECIYVKNMYVWVLWSNFNPFQRKSVFYCGYFRNLANPVNGTDSSVLS